MKELPLNLTKQIFSGPTVSVAVDLIPLLTAHGLLGLAVLLHLWGVERAVISELRVPHSITHFLDVLLGPLGFVGSALDLSGEGGRS